MWRSQWLLCDREADELLDEIEARVLLGPFRGPPAVDRLALSTSSRRWGRWPWTIPRSGRSTSTRSCSTGPAPWPSTPSSPWGAGRGQHAGRRPTSPAWTRCWPAERGGGGRLADPTKWGGMMVANLAGRLPGSHLSGQPQGGHDLRAIPVYATWPSCPRLPTWRSCRCRAAGTRGARGVRPRRAWRPWWSSRRLLGTGRGRARPRGRGGRDGRRATAWRWSAPTAWG